MEPIAVDHLYVFTVSTDQYKNVFINSFKGSSATISECTDKRGYAFDLSGAK